MWIMVKRNAGRVLVAGLALAGAGGWLAGCAGGGGGKAGTNYVEEYRSGDYADAYNQAQAAYMNSDGAAKDRAACVAGLSAYTMGRRDLAEQWLMPVIASSDAEVAGTANWTLGLIASDRNQPARALSYFDRALPSLKGDDAANVHIAAAEALADMNRTGEATARLQTARDMAQTDVVRNKASQRLASGAKLGTPSYTPTMPQLGSRTGAAGVTPATNTAGVRAPVVNPRAPFVIQLGAFANRAAAEKLQRDSMAKTAGAKLPPPLIVSTTDSKTGQGLFAVRVGPFINRADAETARRRLQGAGTVMQGGM
jgi:cell division septation protein DedD